MTLRHALAALTPPDRPRLWWLRTVAEAPFVIGLFAFVIVFGS